MHVIGTGIVVARIISCYHHYIDITIFVVLSLIFLISIPTGCSLLEDVAENVQ
jgi:hypothetical protein